MLHGRPKTFSLHSHKTFFHYVWLSLIILTSLTGHSRCSNSINTYILAQKLYWHGSQGMLDSEGKTHSHAAHLPAKRMQFVRDLLMHGPAVQCLPKRFSSRLHKPWVKPSCCLARSPISLKEYYLRVKCVKLVAFMWESLYSALKWETFLTRHTTAA